MNAQESTFGLATKCCKEDNFLVSKTRWLTCATPCVRFYCCSVSLRPSHFMHRHAVAPSAGKSKSEQTPVLDQCSFNLLFQLRFKTLSSFRNLIYPRRAITTRVCLKRRTFIKLVAIWHSSSKRETITIITLSLLMTACSSPMTQLITAQGTA